MWQIEDTREPPEQHICPSCGGDGQIYYCGRFDKCDRCNGTGVIDPAEERLNHDYYED